MNIFIYATLWLLTPEPTMATPLTCPPTKIINRSSEKWNEEDNKVLKIVQERCKVIYPDAPCCKQFIKRKKQDYAVVCGTP